MIRRQVESHIRRPIVTASEDDRQLGGLTTLSDQQESTGTATKAAV